MSLNKKNRIDTLFESKKNNILSIYFTAGYPNLDSTVKMIEQLEKNGVDMIEIGIPFSDPAADGPIIQNSNKVALTNGMSLDTLFNQLENIREKVTIPLIFMGYFNPIMHFGIEEFCKRCSEIGIDGVIIPDLPPNEYINRYEDIFQKNNLYNILLITPQTSERRIYEIDKLSKGFIYMVSSASTTGIGSAVDFSNREYFSRVKEMKLKNPLLIGFGISEHESFSQACQYADGAIVGSAFIKSLEHGDNMENTIKEFIIELKQGKTVKKLI